jgi:site-specific DNA recombinase
MTKRAAMYVRYSSSNQREESIDAQIRAIEDYCKRKGYIIVKIYSDEAKSATTDDRADFQKMIHESALGLFDVLIVHKLDRFARNRYDSAFYKRKLKFNKVVLESVLEQLDNSPESIILESVLEGMAEYYSKNLAREVRKGLTENANKAVHNGGRPPYGFKINPETKLLEIDQEKAHAVQIFFESVKNNVSLATIAETLNNLGYRTQEGRRFSKNSFFGWAKNRKYIGDYVWNVASSKDIDGHRNNNRKKPIDEQIIKEGILPKIIDPELFQEVNNKMDERKRKPGTMKAKINYLLVGKVFCGNCGSPYNGNSYRNSKSKDNNLLTYYKCAGKCGNTSVRKTDLEELVIKYLDQQCFSMDGIHEISERVQSLYKEYRENTLEEVEPIEKEIKELDSTIENWVLALGKGIKGLEDRIVEAQNRQAFLKNELERISIIQRTHEINSEMIFNIIQEKKRSLFSSNEEDKKQVLQEYVDKITISPSKNINGFDVEIIYRVFNGGGEGTCTPVSKNDHISVYACVLYFIFRRS